VFSNLTETEKLACGDMFVAPRREADSGALEPAENNVFNEQRQVSLRQDSGNKCFIRKVQDTSKVTEKAEVPGSYDKKSTRPRVPLEHRIEVAEFYGTKVPRENKWHERESAVIKDKVNVDRRADIDNKISSASGLLYLKKDKSHLMMTEPHHLKHRKRDTAKLGDSSTYKQEERENKSVVQTSSTASSDQYQKISQMRDYGKKKLRKDKTSSADGRQNYDSRGRFQGRSQYSVAKQQLFERYRQLEASGLYWCCLSVQVILKIWTRSRYLKIRFAAIMICCILIYTIWLTFETHLFEQKDRSRSFAIT